MDKFINQATKAEVNSRNNWEPTKFKEKVRGVSARRRRNYKSARLINDRL